jgi:hypothetical protein
MHHWIKVLLEMVKCFWSSMLPLMVAYFLLLQQKSLLLNVEKRVTMMAVNYQQQLHHHCYSLW